MDWDAVSAIGEVVRAVGVILTLGYLAYQIRQNTIQLERTERTSRAGVVNTSSAAMRFNRTSLYENAEITAIWMNGLKTPDGLSETNRYRFRLMAQNLFDAMWQMHSDAIKTELSPDTWTNQGVAHIRRVMSEPGGRWFWAEFGSYYPNDFRQEV